MRKTFVIAFAASALLTATTFAVSKAQEPRYKLGIQFRPAVVITEVEAGSLAERYGLVKGDIVLEIGGRAPDSAIYFFQTVAKDLEEHGSVKFEVLRSTPEGTKTFTLTISR